MNKGQYQMMDINQRKMLMRRDNYVVNMVNEWGDVQTHSNNTYQQHITPPVTSHRGGVVQC
jgi:hypothetical protein